MRLARFILLPLLVGCAHDEQRLQGTWQSNRDATVAAAFRRDPRWTNAPPEKIQRFTNMFGQMTITYSNGVGTPISPTTFIPSSIMLCVGEAIVSLFVTTRPWTWGGTYGFDLLTGTPAIGLMRGPFGFGLEERFDRMQE